MIDMPISTWSDYKDLVITEKGLDLQFSETRSRYHIYASEQHIFLWSIALVKNGGSDVTDFENNYKYNSNKKIEILTHVHIQEENIATGGHYQAQGYKVDVTQDGDNELILSFPMNTGLLAAKWANLSKYKDDEIEFLVGEDTVIGTLTANHLSGDTILNVSQTVIDNTSVGYYLKINSQDVGRVLSIDSGALQVTVETALTANENSGTAAKQTIKLLPMSPLTEGGKIDLGESKVGASFVPANTQIKAVYHRHSQGQADDFVFYLEYLY